MFVVPIQSQLVMIFSISKRFRHIPLIGFASLFGSRSYGVRPNASDRFFSTKASEAIIFRDPTSLEMKSLLESYGFTDAHIYRVIARCPNIFTLDAKNNILPKLKFFTSIGLSNKDLPKLASRSYFILSSSLQNQIIPNCSFLSNNVRLSNEQLARALKLHPGLLSAKLDTVLAPNIAFLRQIGLGPPEIASMVARKPAPLCRNHEAFRICIDKVLSMGLKPSMGTFASAFHVVCGLSEAKLKEKMMLYRSYGLSDDEILLAFQTKPWIMGLSKANISKSIEFFIEELKWTPSDVARAPDVVVISLDNAARRSRVLKKLVEKGLKREAYLRGYSYLKLSKEKFLDRYVNRYSDDLPEILDIYYEGLFGSKKRAEESDVGNSPPKVLISKLDRVARRNRVLEKLVEKGLKPEAHHRLSSYLKLSEEKFLDSYVNRYARDWRELLDIYKGLLGSK